MNMSDSFNHLGSIWYQSEPLEFPYCPNQSLGLDLFFVVSNCKPALVVPAQSCSTQASQAVEVALTGTKSSQLNALHNG